ncbi:hypothetical protein ACO0QE_002690 [Hanseniaspora vineae]
MSAFFKNEQSLLDVYGLASNNPKGKWAECSTFSDLSKPLVELEKDGSKMTTEQAHDILNELGKFERRNVSTTGEGNSAGINTDTPPFIDIDPLDGHQISDRLPNIKDPMLYSINSTKFNPKLFLQNVHSKDSFEQFTKYLDTLDSDLNHQSSDLRKFVHSNFTRYVRSKNNLDNIYEQFNAGSAQLSGGGSADANSLKKTTANEDEKFQFLEKSVLDSSKKGVVLSKKLMISDDLIKNYAKAISFIESSAGLINLPGKLKTLLNNGNYSELLYEYSNAKKTYCSMKPGPNERKVWNEVENVVDQYRQHLWNLLLENDTGSGFIESKYNFLPIISKLLDLDVEDSPICLWIDAKLEQAKNKLNSVSSLMSTKLEEKKLSLSLQNLALYSSSSSSEPGVLPEKLSYYLQFTKQSSFSETQFVDQTAVVEMWFLIIKYINDIHQLATSFVEFWGNVQNFLNGSFQQSIINDKRRENIIFGNSNTGGETKFALELESYQIENIIEKGTDFVSDLIILLQNFFEVNPEIPTEFKFLVPGCNNLSCLRYLPMVVEPVFRLCNDIGQLNIDPKVNGLLQKTCSQILENSIAAINFTRLEDYRQFDILETWSIYEFNENLGQTGKCTFLPIIVKNASIVTINTLQDLVFFHEMLPVSVNNFRALGKPLAVTMKRLQEEQVEALETVLESLLKDANRKKENPRTTETLLTLNNIQVLAKDAFPFILNYFQAQFDISSENASELSNLQMFTILEKMHSSILTNYASDLKYELRQTLEKGFTSIDWLSYTTTSFRASDYILEVLMILVQVHRDCSNISPDMSQKITSEAQQFISTYLYKLFKEHIDGVSTDGLLQVTLDFEFFIRVLSNILDAESERKLKSCLLYCFHNNSQKLEECIQQIQGAIDTSMNRTAIQFASFRD